MEQWIARVEERLAAEPSATLASLEAQPGWTHFPIGDFWPLPCSIPSRTPPIHTAATPKCCTGVKDRRPAVPRAGRPALTARASIIIAIPTCGWRRTACWSRISAKERRERWRQSITVDIDELAAIPPNDRIIPSINRRTSAHHPIISHSGRPPCIWRAAYFGKQGMAELGSESAAPLRRRAIARWVLGRAFQRRSDHRIRLPDFHRARRIL